MRLKQLREENNLSQLDLANKLNMSQQTISAYEKGTREPDIETIKKISDFFNVSTDYLICKTDIRSNDKEEQEFRFAYHKEMEGLTDKEISDALRFYKEMKKKVKGDK